MGALLSLVLSSIAFIVSTECWAADACLSQELSTRFGTWFALNKALDAVNPTVPLPASGFDFIPASYRVSLSVDAATTDRQWSVVGRDEKLHVLVVLGPDDFESAGHQHAASRWTGRLKGSAVSLELMARPNSDARLQVEEGMAYAPDSPSVQQYSVKDKNGNADWRDLYSVSDLLPKKRGDAVGMLLSAKVGAGNDNDNAWCCSGVMITSNVLLTNWHCGARRLDDPDHWSQTIVDNTIIDLSWDDGHVSRQYSGTKLLLLDKELDFALLQVRPVAGGGAGTSVRARIASRLAAAGDAIFLIHHPQCKPKVVSSHCQIVDPNHVGWMNTANATEFTHNCDTEPGSSGAPVFNEKGDLIGLHHVGFQTLPACGLDRVNKAVQIDAIITEIKDKAPDVYKELWFD